MNNKIQNIIEKRPNLIPYFLISIVLLIIFICSFGVGIPLYNYANNREIHQVELAKDGLNNFIRDLEFNVSNSAYQLSQDKGFINKINDMINNKEDGVGTLRRKINEYVLFNNINYFELIDTNGVILFNLDNDYKREGLSLSNNYFFNQLTESNQINSIDIINNKIYLLSSIYVFNNSKKEAVILMGKEITHDIINEWSKKLTTDIVPLIFHRKQNKYEFPDFQLDSTYESYISKISFDSKNISSFVKRIADSKKYSPKINIDNNEYAVSILEINNIDKTNELRFFILRSLKDFTVSMHSIIWYVFLFTIPFLIIIIIAILFLEKTLINLNLNIKYAHDRLKKNYDSLKTAQSNLSIRIKDAHVVKILSDNLAEINDIESLENEIAHNVNLILKNLNLYVKYSINNSILIPEEILNKNILWKKETLKNSQVVSVYICFGETEMTERETILMDTIYSTANLRFNNICYNQEIVNKKITENEIEIAKRVHRAIMPEYYPSSPFFDLKGYYEAATTLGGDFLSCCYDEEAKVLRAYIGDVTGHGIPSAILSTAVMAQVEAFEADIKVKNRNYNFDDFFRSINSIVWRLGKQQFTMTFQILEVDFKNQKIRIFNAAHNPILLGQKSGDLNNNNKLFKAIMGTGIFLGYAAQYQNRYFTKEIEFKKGISLIMYTDGIIEALDENNNPYSLKKLNSIFSNNFHLDAEGMINACLQDFRKITGNKNLEDDITLLILKIL